MQNIEKVGNVVFVYIIKKLFIDRQKKKTYYLIYFSRMCYAQKYGNALLGKRDSKGEDDEKTEECGAADGDVVGTDFNDGVYGVQ